MTKNVIPLFVNISRRNIQFTK